MSHICSHKMPEPGYESGGYRVGGGIGHDRLQQPEGRTVRLRL